MWWKEHPEEAKHSREVTYECQYEYCSRYFYSYGNPDRKYCCHDCYIMDRFWNDPSSDTRVIKQDHRVLGI